MTIYFNGHPFKYEVEGVCKLFFPLVRFCQVFDGEPDGVEDYVLTDRRQAEETRLTVEIRLGDEIRREEDVLPGDTPRYDNECERRLCALIYRILSEWLSVYPSWGILTGVRPVNILQKERVAGKSDTEIAAFFQEKYLVSPQKLELAFATADRQTGILRSMPPRSFSLYVAIPFCASRCSYCSFVSHAITTRKATDKVDEYVRLLCVELAETAKLAGELGLQLDTVYVGGGTPTALSAEQLRRVLFAVTEHFDVDSAREFTVEAGRADTITPEKLEVIRSAGGRRVSVNPQTFNDEVLQNIGRRHTAQDALEAYRMARETGFDAVNMDFIAGLPGDTLESFCSTIDRAVSLRPENITVHTLTVKRSADLFWEKDIARRLAADQTAEMTEYARKALIGAGYSPYYLYRQKNTVGNLENVGYALSGTESLYNVYIMDEIQTILACGAGGVTKVVGRGENPIRRVFNFKYHFEYIDRFEEILKRKEQVRAYYDGEE